VNSKFDENLRDLMKILLTGANGYIGSRLLPALAEAGIQVVALVRSEMRLSIPEHLKSYVTVITADLLNEETLQDIPKDIDAAYYLVHSMREQSEGFSSDERLSAQNFTNAISKTECKQVIYLSGLAQSNNPSEHMSSRLKVEEVLQSGPIPVTVLRAGIIIGSGSASFEIIRDLVEKLPVMIVPRWVQSICQPIAIADVIFYLKEVLGNKEFFHNHVYEIGGPETLTYHQMLVRFANARRLKRLIIPVPVLTPKLSSWWLFFIASTSFPLARALVNSLKGDADCKEYSIQKMIPHQCISYEESLSRAFVKIEQNAVVSSWKDAIVRSKLNPNLEAYIEVPTNGCLKVVEEIPYTNRSAAIERLWQIGGKNGWYYMNWAWVMRGWVDRICGGIGLIRGRTDPLRLRNGDVLDFWRVLLADKESGHLLLYAEMRIPGEAWLEYIFEGDEYKGVVRQKAIFRPKGILGRFYWYLLIPVHNLIFRGLCSYISMGDKKGKL